MTALYPAATWRPVPNHSGPMSAHLGLVLHVQVGNGSVYGEFSNPASSASYTWWVAKDGTVEQYVDADLAAWAQAGGNGTYNSVGTEGYPAELLTDAQCQAIAGIWQWGAQLYGWPHQLAEAPGEPGFGWHGMGDSNGHSGWGGHPGCPGDARRAQRQHILDLAQGEDMIDLSPIEQKLDAVLGALTQGVSVDDAGRPMNAAWSVATDLAYLRAIRPEIETIKADVAAIKAKLGA